MTEERISLPPKAPGFAPELVVQRFGKPGARPKAYVQAALHADEVPAMMAAHHLRELLSALERDGRIRGEIVLVPAANPIGLSQRVLGVHEGRFDLADGQNFNRGYPELTQAVDAKVADHLGADPTTNVTLIRNALRDVILAAPSVRPMDALKRQLLLLAHDADLVLDVHCDGDAVMHLYTHTALADTFSSLAAYLGAEALLVAPVSGGDPFDEAVSRPWVELAEKHPDRPIPLACASATLELRGQRDVSHALGRADAQAMVQFLTAEGVISGPQPDRPPARCRPTPLSGSEALEAPVSGILVYAREAGDRVAKGDLIAEIVDPLTGHIAAVTASTDGVLYARAGGRFADAGQRIGKIAGTDLKRTGRLLSP